MSDQRLATLYRTFGGAIYSHCRRILDDPQAAEDATQETFLRVHRHLEDAPDMGQALRWIYRIATNYCLNEVRNRKLRPLPVERLPEGTPVLPIDGPIADRQLVQRVVARVPEKLRAVAWLYHVDGMDQTEVADVLGISRRTVVNRLNAFREKARRQLDP